ncbi:MAG: protoheme IX farnesyltransferase [Candidatus Heimdallarchaeota archaeon]|nr:MAG: protoheme IX farnesyltransferase [Candidatus Heimdallarchaeota archaeon]
MKEISQEKPSFPYIYGKMEITKYPPLTLSTYSELIKSKQTFLLVYTTIFTYLISAWSTPGGLQIWDLIWITTSLFFAVSGSTLLNMYIDQDIDALMERTKDRPLPSGKIHPSTALKHGILFVIVGIILSGALFNFITMLIVFMGFFFDVIVYSLLLKRRTRFSIVFGGIAGGLPAIAGRTAVTGTIDMIALLIGFFVLAWIPLHILTLALIPKNLEDYRNAKIPMWPVVTNKNQTIRVITISAVLSGITVVFTGFILGIHFLPMLPLLIFCFYILYHTGINFKRPSEQRTFRIFKIASMFMGFAFLWLFFGIVVSSLFF